MKFILSRTEDFAIHSKKWIVGYGLLFWFVSRIIAMLLVMGCVAVYNTFGINPETLTRFAGNPETVRSLGSMTYVLLTVSIVAPILEECIFRLGLSFKRWQVALAVVSIPAYILWQHLSSLTIVSALPYLVSIIAVFFLIYGLTSDSYWNELRKTCYTSTIWVSTIAFGLIHLIAFSYYSFYLVPYMLCVISVPFFGGCAMTYYRINLGFWWGVGMHIFNNLPAIILLISL